MSAFIGGFYLKKIDRPRYLEHLEQAVLSLICPDRVTKKIIPKNGDIAD
jgi:hypothetical protein